VAIAPDGKHVYVETVDVAPQPGFAVIDTATNILAVQGIARVERPELTGVPMLAVCTGL